MNIYLFVLVLFGFSLGIVFVKRLWGGNRLASGEQDQGPAGIFDLVTSVFDVIIDFWA